MIKTVSENCSAASTVNRNVRTFLREEKMLLTDYDIIGGILFAVRAERAQGEVFPITLIAKWVVPGVKSNYSMEVVRR